MDGSLGTSWTAPAFDDSSWTSGTSGVGFDKGLSTFAGDEIWDGTSYQGDWSEAGGNTKASLTGSTLNLATSESNGWYQQDSGASAWEVATAVGAGIM